MSIEAFNALMQLGLEAWAAGVVANAESTEIAITPVAANIFFIFTCTFSLRQKVPRTIDGQARKSACWTRRRLESRLNDGLDQELSDQRLSILVQRRDAPASLPAAINAVPVE
jgi:hypothetical protein